MLLRAEDLSRLLVDALEDCSDDLLKGAIVSVSENGVSMVACTGCLNTTLHSTAGDTQAASRAPRWQSWHWLPSIQFGVPGRRQAAWAGTAPRDLRQPGKGRPIAYWMLWATVVIRIRTNDRASCAVLSTSASSPVEWRVQVLLEGDPLRQRGQGKHLFLCVWTFGGAHPDRRQNEESRRNLNLTMLNRNGYLGAEGFEEPQAQTMYHL